jgi:hypothetical protein
MRRCGPILEPYKPVEPIRAAEAGEESRNHKISQDTKMVPSLLFTAHIQPGPVMWPFFHKQAHFFFSLAVLWDQ